MLEPYIYISKGSLHVAHALTSQTHEHDIMTQADYAFSHILTYVNSMRLQ